MSSTLEVTHGDLVKATCQGLGIKVLELAHILKLNPNHLYRVTAEKENLKRHIRDKIYSMYTDRPMAPCCEDSIRGYYIALMNRERLTPGSLAQLIGVTEQSLLIAIRGYDGEKGLPLRILKCTLDNINLTPEDKEQLIELYLQSNGVRL